jgi:hypothetical protein
MIRSVYLEPRVLLLLLVVTVWGLDRGGAVGMAQTSEAPPRISQVELQSELMSFADRFVSTLAESEGRFEAQGPTPEAHLIVLRSAFGSAFSVFTLAASANPEIALLDLVSLMTLGRMIYATYWGPKLGPAFKPFIEGFKEREADIWSIAARVLSPAEQQELRDFIATWRRQHPKQVVFSTFRFTEFAGERFKGTAAEKRKARGLFKSVTEATRKVDEALLLAERGIFLGTRLMLLSQLFAKVLVTQTLMTPNVSQLLNDTNTLSVSIRQLAQQTERLPTQIRKEREATITQALDGIRREREAITQGLVAEEARLRGVLSDLQQTLTLGNELMTSASSTMDTAAVLAERFGLDAANPSLDLAAASTTIQHLNTLIGSLMQLLTSPGWDQRLPQLLQVADHLETKGEDFVGFTTDQAFVSAVLLILMLLIGSVLAALAYQALSRWLFERRLTPGPHRQDK